MLFKISFAYAEPECSQLFQSDIQNRSDITLKNQLQKLLLNDLVVTKINNARILYYADAGNLQYAGEFASALKDVSALVHKSNISGSEKIALSLGLNKILDDLEEIPPEYISTERILKENVALIIANASREASKVLQNEHNGNVVTISDNKMKLNSDYIQARKKIFEMMDSYSQKDSMPSDLKLTRVEEMLYADVRYQLLKAFERESLAYRIVSLIENANHLPIEDALEKYYSSGRAGDL
jgi:hypothetical protein